MWTFFSFNIQVDELLDDGDADIRAVLSKCPNAKALFVSATVSDRAMEGIRKVSNMAIEDIRKLTVIQTQQLTRPAFQVDFTLASWESKVRGRRRSVLGVCRCASRAG